MGSEEIQQKDNNIENLQELGEQVLEDVTGGLSKNEKAALYGVGGGAALGGVGYAAAHSPKVMNGLMGASMFADVGTDAALISHLV